MRKGRPIPVLTMTGDERDTLERWARRPKTAQALAQRAQIILQCASGKTNTEVATHLRISKQMVGKWRHRFINRRLDGLLDEPRPGTPRRLSDVEVERVLTMTLESTPKNATHWSTRSLAAACGLSNASIHRVWQAFGLAPHRSESFKLSKDPLFIDKVRDIVGLYMAPPDKALVLCVDEKAQIQALDRSQPILPMRPGQLRCLLPWTLRPARSLVSFIAAIVRWSSVSSSTRSTPKCHRSWRFISFSTTMAPIRRRPFSAGCSNGHASTSISRLPVLLGSISWSVGLGF